MDPLNHKTVLVTGAAGGIGRTVCRHLAGQHIRVKGLVRPEDNTRGLEIHGEDLVRGSVEDTESVAKAMQEAEAVIHCASLLPGDAHLGKALFHRVNMEGALNVLREAGRQKISPVIFFSTVSVVDHFSRRITKAQLREYLENPDDPYLSSKIALEKALARESEHFEGQIVILRPTFVYGPGNFTVWRDALNLVTQRKMVLVGGGNACLPLLYADDLAKFILFLLSQASGKKSFDIHVLSSAETTTMKQVFYFIADHLGIPRPKSVPYGLLSLATRIVSALPESLRLGRLKLLTPTRLLQYSKGYDLSGVMNPLPHGFVSSMGYQEGLALMLEDYKRSLRPSGVS